MGSEQHDIITGPILGIDPGEKRVGVAISDPGRRVAHPRETLTGSVEYFPGKIAELAEIENISAIVVGLPINANGKEGAAAQATRALVEKLELLVEIPLLVWDERFSSMEAERVLIAGNVRRKKRKSVRDKLAATLILQSYLDKISFDSGNE